MANSPPYDITLNTVSIITMSERYTNLAPIILFAFNRPDHTAETLSALKRSYLADQSELFVFLDGPRSADDEKKISEVRSLITDTHGFKNVEIIQRPRNIGLANNITDGVTKIIQRKKRVIVLEDDIVVSPGFLIFMNTALDRYCFEKKIWHIGGYNEAIDNHEEKRTFLWRVMRCWGWATWDDRWSYYRKDTKSLINRFSKSDIYRFNLDDNVDFWNQVLLNDTGRLNTWAVFWYATIFINNGLCLNPTVSHVINIGFDGSGTHCSSDNSGKHSIKCLNSSISFVFPLQQVEDKEIVDKIKQHNNRPSLTTRFFSRISRHFKAFMNRITF